jgi:hypothetical protein
MCYVITNVIAAATAAIGIHTLTAVDDLSSVGCMVDHATQLQLIYRY